MVSTIFKRGTRAFLSEQHTILSAAAVIGSIYVLSAFLGFIRNRMLSGYFGDSAELGIFFAADVIPNLILSLVVSGALSSAFIPVFNKVYKDDPDKAWGITSIVLNTSLLIFLIFTLVVFFSADFISREIIAKNSSLTVSDLAMMASLMRVMMFAQVIFILSNFFTSILQSFKRFVVPSLAPVMYNLGIIIFIVLFVGKYGIFAPAYGMIFGALLHMAIQLPLVKNLGFKYSRIVDIRNKGVREIYALFVPRAIGQAAQKILVPLYTNLALFISAPSNVILTFATDIQNVPVRVFGISLGQAALPLLSLAYNKDNTTDFKKLLMKTLHQVIFFVMPISILIFILRVPLVRLAVGARKYPWEATVMTAYSLGFFSISIVAQALVLILARAFYAACDTKTPLKISLVSMMVSASFAVFFVKYLHLGVWSISLSYTIGSFVNCLLLFIAVVKRLGGIDLRAFLEPVNRIGFATLITGLALYIPLKVLDGLIFDTTRTFGLFVLTGTVTLIGFVTYSFLAKILKIKEYELLVSSLMETSLVRRFVRKAI